MTERNKQDNMRLGTVIFGSLMHGVQVKLDPGRSVEEIAVGRYVAIKGEKKRFFGMITDVSLEAVDPRAMVMPPDISDPFIAKVVSGTTTYGKISVLPMLTISGDAATMLEGPQPAKTVPSHFSEVQLASQRDVELVFGLRTGKGFTSGHPSTWRPRYALTWKSWSSVPTECSARAVRGKHSSPGYCLSACCRKAGP